MEIHILDWLTYGLITWVIFLWIDEEDEPTGVLGGIIAWLGFNLVYIPLMFVYDIIDLIEYIVNNVTITF